MAKTNTTFRAGEEELEALAVMQQALSRAVETGTGPARRAMPQGAIIRLAILAQYQGFRDGRDQGARDKAAGRSRRRGMGRELDFRALGYWIGFGEDVPSYRRGKAEGEDARREGRELELPALTRESDEYQHGLVDGARGGFLQGLADGRAARRAGLADESPKEDPAAWGHYGIGYRAGRLAGDPDYARGVEEGRSAFEAGTARGTFEDENPRPARGDRNRRAEGRRDGYFGFARAGLLEGEADRDNGRHTPPDGRSAFTAYAFGYRTAGRCPGIETAVDNEFAEWSAGRDMGRRDRELGLPDGAPADDRSPFASGYRYGHAGEQRVFRQGMRWDPGADCAETSAEALAEASAETSAETSVVAPEDEGPFAVGSRTTARPILDLVTKVFVVDPLERALDRAARQDAADGPAGEGARAGTNATLPIQLDPAGHAFRRRLVETGEAWLTTHYEDGGVDVRRWDASRMTLESNVVANLRSRPDHRNPRWRELGIAKVVVTVDAVFALVLEASYCAEGFFDVPAEYDRHAGDAGAVELTLGGGSHVAGRIDRSANADGTARVFGGAELRDWFQRGHVQGDGVLVRFRSPGRIEIG